MTHCPRPGPIPRHCGISPRSCCRNALQATPAGGKIHVRATTQGDELLWSFSDTGKGIGDEEAVHLFDPFYCGRQAGRGLGLGLPRPPGSSSLPAAGCDGLQTQPTGPSFQVHLPLTDATRPGEPIASRVNLRFPKRALAQELGKLGTRCARPSASAMSWQSTQRNVTLSGSL